MGPLDDLLAQYMPNPDEVRRQQRTALLMNLAGGLLSARRGQELQGAGMGLLGGASAAAQVPQDAQMRALQLMQMRGAGMDYLTKQNAFEQQQKYQQALGAYTPPDARSTLPSLAPTPANAQALSSSQQNMGPYEQYKALAQYLRAQKLPEKAMEADAMAEKYAPQYDKIDTLMQDGKPVSVQTFKNRAPQTLPGYQPKPDFKQINTGQQTMFYDPLTKTQGGSFQMETTPDALLSADTTRRGQNLTDARAQQQIAQAERHFQTTQAQPVWDATAGVFVTKPTGGNAPSAIPVSGLPDKPLTEVQGNATAFGMRANAANQQFNELEKGGAPVGSVTALLAKNPVSNYVAPDWAQKAQQAKLNFMSATLRKESGAAISQSEYDAEDKKYFPQPGDKPPVIEQKRKMRDLAIKTLQVQAGPGAKKIVGGGWSIKPID